MPLSSTFGSYTLILLLTSTLHTSVDRNLYITLGLLQLKRILHADATDKEYSIITIIEKKIHDSNAIHTPCHYKLQIVTDRLLHLITKYTQAQQTLSKTKRLINALITHTQNKERNI